MQQKDELIYGGVNFTPSVIAAMPEEAFVTSHAQANVWPEMTWQERKETLEKVFTVCKDIVRAEVETLPEWESPKEETKKAKAK